MGIGGLGIEDWGLRIGDWGLEIDGIAAKGVLWRKRGRGPFCVNPRHERLIILHFYYKDKTKPRQIPKSPLEPLGLLFSPSGSRGVEAPRGRRLCFLLILTESVTVNRHAD